MSKINYFLLDLKFIESSCFEDKAYLKSLFRKLHGFSAHSPVKIKFNFKADCKIRKFDLEILERSKRLVFPISSNISVLDYNKFLHRKLKFLYPKLEGKVIETKVLSSDALAKQVLLGQEIETDVKVIEKNLSVVFSWINLENHNFRCEIKDLGNLNSKPYSIIRLANIPILKFMENIKSNHVNLEWVWENSIYIRKFEEPDIDISLPLYQMQNFYIVNFKELKYSKLENVDSYNYKLKRGRFNIFFESKYLMDTCESYMLLDKPPNLIL